MGADADALVVGAGPAGSAAAILLAQAGWRVVLVEQHAFPRQKVCGECISAGSLAMLDALGVGAEFRAMAGPELHRVGWIGRGALVEAEFPPCRTGDYRFGRAAGRDRLDVLLVERARALGVEVVQPAKVRRVHGGPGHFHCEIERRDPRDSRPRPQAGVDLTRRARVLIDAHGSWEPSFDAGERLRQDRARRRDSDLFAFKATFKHSTLAPGLLPVVAFEGGYGGIVVSDGGRTTLACCIRRDALRACRASAPGISAGGAVEAYLRLCCPGLRAVLDHAERGAWLSVGPIRPGIRVDAELDTFRVGNAAGETHPLIGEGIGMALQSAGLLAGHLSAQPAAAIDSRRTRALNRSYAAAWHAAFAPRLRFAAGYAHMAMRPALAAPLRALLQRWPSLLTRAARWAGKARRSVVHS